MADTTVVGAPLPEDQIDWKPVLSGMGSDKVIAVFNPLSNDFRVIYSRALPDNAALSPGAALARERTGLDLSKRSNAQKYVQQHLILKSGSTTNLPGDIAQKAVQDLVTYMISSRGNKNRIADPFTRQQTEQEVILSIKDSSEFFNRPSSEPAGATEAELAALNPAPEAPAATAAADPPPGQGASY